MKTQEHLSQWGVYDTISKTDGDCALHVSCSLVQLARVVVCVLVLVVVLCVMIVVLNAHMDVVHAEDIVLVTIFVMIFCNWKCTLYTFPRFHTVQRMWRTFQQNGTRANWLQKKKNSKNTFIQKRFHPMTLSSKTGFIQWHFHPKPFSSQTQNTEN